MQTVPPSSARSIPTKPLVNRTLAKAVSRLLVTAALLTPITALAAPISIKELRTLQLNKKPHTLIDVRDPNAYKKEHIQGAINVPLESIRAWQPPANTPIIVYCTCPNDITAADILIERGFKKTRILEGRYASWKNAKYPIVYYGKGTTPKQTQNNRITAKEAKEKIEEGTLQPIDIRPKAEYEMGHLPGAIHLELELLKLVVKLPEDQNYLIYGRKSKRTKEAAKLIREAGYTVVELSGGIAGWAGRKYPMEVK